MHLVLLLAFSMVSLSLLPSCEAAPLRSTDDDPERISVLVFSKTEGYRHESIAAGVAAIDAQSETHGLTVAHTEDASQFNDDVLADVDVVVFLNTTGTVFDDAQRAAMERFVRRGGGFVGVHSATDTEYEWDWYGRLIGAYFHSHPHIQEALVQVVDGDHPSTAHLSAEWMRRDEWYNFRTRPDHVHVLLSLDTSTFEGSTMGDDHPIAWYHEFDGGRAWYTAGGHTVESYAEPDFRRHLIEGIVWAAGRSEGGD